MELRFSSKPLEPGQEVAPKRALTHTRNEPTAASDQNAADVLMPDSVQGAPAAKRRFGDANATQVGLARPGLSGASCKKVAKPAAEAVILAPEDLETPLLAEHRPLTRGANEAERLAAAVFASSATVPAKSPTVSDALEDNFWACKFNSDIELKKQYVRDFNSYIAPRLVTEEAALEQLAMRHAYLYQEPGQRFAFNIKQGLLDNREPGNLAGSKYEGAYAASYSLEKLVIDKTNGLKASILQPLRLPDDDEKKPARTIVVFPGTQRPWRMDFLCRKAGHPTGEKADADPRGVGHTAFAANEGMLKVVVREALERGAEVTITGHSLGGAYATRLMAALTPEEQKQCHLVTFNAPALDPETARRVADTADVRIIRMRNDMVTKGGREHPQGTIIKLKRVDRVPLRQIRRNHTTPRLSHWEMDGEVPKFFIVKPHWSDAQVYAEVARRLLSILMRPKP